MAKKGLDIPGDVFPLMLTQKQRASLLQLARLKQSIKQKVERAGAGTGTRVVLVSGEDLDDLDEEIGQAAEDATGVKKRQFRAILAKVAECFFPVVGARPTAKARAAVRRPPPVPGLRFQFKITLLDITPKIRRRIRVPDCTLGELHDSIQRAFGWDNCHLYMFKIDQTCYGQREPEGMDFGLEMEDEDGVVLSTLLPETTRKARWIYEYDFGDDWRHEIVFEKLPPGESEARLPVCLEGARACPPEDCGGPWGYMEYVAALADPRHERHKELLRWGGPFDPEAFDAKKATRAMQGVR